MTIKRQQPSTLRKIELLSSYWHALWRLGDADDPDPESWALAADVSAYLFACNAEAWRSFWQGLHIDADALTGGNHGGWLLRDCEGRMPGVAPTREELAARLRRHGAADPQ